MRLLGMFILSILSAVLLVLFFNIMSFGMNIGDFFSAFFTGDNLGDVWPQFLFAWGFIFFLLLGARLAFGTRKRRSRRE